MAAQLEYINRCRVVIYHRNGEQFFKTERLIEDRLTGFL